MHELTESETTQLRNAHRLCPASKGATALSIATKDAALFAVGCRKWACKACGPIRKRRLVAAIVRAKPSTFITLTCRHDGEPRDQLTKIARALPRLVQHIRESERIDIEYFRMLEQCNDSYPHFHLLARCNYIPQDTLSQKWESLTGARVVDIRKAHGRSTGYVAKYLAKARNEHGAWSRQRCSASRKFWAKEDEREQEWIDWQWPKMGVYEHAQRLSADYGFEERHKGTWTLTERSAGDDLPDAITSVYDTWD